MALKFIKPVTPSQRGNVRIDYSKELSYSNSKTPKKLRKPLKGSAGRSGGRISIRHKSRGVKSHYRVIDFSRKIRNVNGEIKSIEYDPNRSAFISLVVYENGLKSYILTPKGVKVGDKVISGDEVSLEVGNATKLSRISPGIEVHNIELNPGSGGTMVRSAGTSAVILGSDGVYTQLRLPSKEVRLVNSNSYATIGSISNSDYINTNIGKAGINRRKGVRPTTRGMVQDPSSHPHGGGEGKGVIGHVPKDKWGNVRGKLTRRKKNRFNKFRLSNRKGGKIVTK